MLKMNNSRMLLACGISGALLMAVVLWVCTVGAASYDGSDSAARRVSERIADPVEPSHDDVESSRVDIGDAPNTESRSEITSENTARRCFVFGRVVDDLGNPVEGADIRFRAADHDFLAKNSKDTTRTALTAADGTFDVGEVTSGVWLVTVLRNGYEAVFDRRTVVPRAWTYSLSAILVARFSRIQGLIQDRTMKPVEGARIVLPNFKSSEHPLLERDGIRVIAISDARGEFSMETWPEGALRVVVAKEGFVPAELPRPIVQPGITGDRIEIVLDDEIEVMGTLSGATPEDIEKVRVVARAVDRVGGSTVADPVCYSDLVSAEVEPSGQFSVRGCIGGVNYVVQAVSEARDGRTEYCSLPVMLEMSAHRGAGPLHVSLLYVRPQLFQFDVRDRVDGNAVRSARVEAMGSAGLWVPLEHIAGLSRLVEPNGRIVYRGPLNIAYLEGLLREKGEIRIVAPGYQPEELGSVDVGGSVNEIVCVLNRTARLSVTVHDELAGALEGASVKLRGLKDYFIDPSWPDFADMTGVTDRSGRVILSRPENGTLVAVVEMPGFIPVRREFQTRSERDQEEKFVLNRGAQVVIKVISSNGRPCENELVELRSEKSWVELGIKPRRTDESGEAWFDALPEGEYLATCVRSVEFHREDNTGGVRRREVHRTGVQPETSRSGHAAFVVQGAEPEPIKSTIILPSCATLRGRVEHSFGTLNSVARLRWIPGKQSPVLVGAFERATGQREVTTDRNGQFQLLDVQSGEWTVQAALEGSSIPLHTTLNVGPDSSEFVVLRFESGSVSGKVIGTNGAPVCDASVELRYASSAEPGLSGGGTVVDAFGVYWTIEESTRSAKTRTDNDGVFHFPVLPARIELTLMVHAPNYCNEIQELTLASGAEELLAIEMVIGGELIVSVVDAMGNPALNSRVTITNEVSKRSIQVLTGRTGCAAFRGLEVGEWGVSAERLNLALASNEDYNIPQYTAKVVAGESIPLRVIAK